jgi:hypothetical protein
VARNVKAPALGDAGAHKETSHDRGGCHVNTLARFQAQALAVRYALPIELAAMIAPLALGGAHV